MLGALMSTPPRIARTEQFSLAVRAVESLSPRMRRITLCGPGLVDRHWPLACDIAVVLPGSDGRELRRRYTVRSVVDDALIIDAVLHGHGPGSSWAQGVAVGDPVSFFGPRGEVPLTSAGRVLALTDESGLPAIGAVAEALGASSSLTVLAEVANPEERYPLPDGVDVTWIVRAEHSPGTPDLLLAAIEETPPRSDFAYVLGESRAIVMIRDELTRFGIGREAVYAKGYWNLNSRPTR